MRASVEGLTRDAVHVWSFDLTIAPPGDVESKLLRALSDSEHKRAAAFVFERDRRRYLRSHMQLRYLLGGYLDLDAAQVPIRLGEHDKPMLDMAEPLGFNLSHSSDTALVAVCTRSHVGVDVEVTGAHRDLPALTRTVFTEAERRELSEVDARSYERAFLTLWTRKEAVLKAIGTGLTLEPASLQVGLRGRAPAARVSVPVGSYGEAADVADLDVGIDRVAAVAVCGGWSTLKFFRENVQQLPGDLQPVSGCHASARHEHFD